MQIKKKPCGPYMTNCYIVKVNDVEFIVDPGVGADEWVKQNVTNPVAILNTHGHFDHIWSNASLSEYYNIPIYTPKDDVFMLTNDPFSQGTPPSIADVEVKGDEVFEIENVEVRYFFFPGHTPGCSAVLIEDALFSGDFIFKNSIGRVDFPYSNPNDMKNSIKKFLQIDKNYTIYPGHGENTSVFEEQKSVPAWLNYI
ncbi:MAG: MBL fold metallo-hydrolase [Sulfurospirillaceae bacterium]|nr:MBL fold metallo-hydrolase [Sulfurospirillaceae bacterium]